MEEVEIKILSDLATIPTYGSELAAGCDLYAAIDKNIEIEPNKTEFISTGISLAIPKHLVGLIFARSGLGCKHGIAPSNKVGVIDSDYRGEIIVALHNHSEETFIVKPKDRIAQMVFMPFYQAKFIEKEELEDTVRGTGGFGSTGEN